MLNAIIFTNGLVVYETFGAQLLLVRTMNHAE
jgi:hypothetical protein